jgi:hypothetical protein
MVHNQTFQYLPLSVDIPFLAPPLGFDEQTNHTLKTAMGKSLDGLQEWWEDNLKVILFAIRALLLTIRHLHRNV